MKKIIFTVFIASLTLTGCSFSFSSGTNANAPSNTAAGNSGANKPSTNAAPAAPSNASTPAAKPAEARKKDPEEDMPSDTEADETSTEEHIQFAKGETEATLERTIAPGVNKMYLFTAKKDQTISLRVDEATNQLGVSFNKNPVKLNVDVTKSLNANGEWAIYVDNPTNKVLKYSLSLGIQ